MFVAIDGNMQLRRRKKDSQDTNKVKEHTFFSADDRQHKYERVVPAATSSKCSSDFKAGSEKANDHNNDHYFECGVVGSMCRHDIPLEFTNIYESGERSVLII